MRSISVAVIICFGVSLAGASLVPFEYAVGDRPSCVANGASKSSCWCSERCTCCVSAPVKSAPQPQPAAMGGSEIQTTPKALTASATSLPAGTLADVEPPIGSVLLASGTTEPPLYTLTHAFLI